MLRYGLNYDPRAFGTLGLTILKDAKVFGAPLGDAGHAYGFIAIGDMSLPTRDGCKVGCVTIKGPRDRIEKYPQMIQDAITSVSLRGTMVTPPA